MLSPPNIQLLILIPLNISMDTKISTKVNQHLEQNWRFWLGIVYFTLLIVVAVAVVRRQMPAPTAPPPAAPPAVVVQPVTTPQPDPELIAALARIAALEQQLERQNAVAKAREDAVTQAQQRTERRLQAHTEAFKRMCEYILVITIDKKLVPRQCLPEYRWSREEGT
jgi:hypothetical protein